MPKLVFGKIAASVPEIMDTPCIYFVYIYIYIYIYTYIHSKFHGDWFGIHKEMAWGNTQHRARISPGNIPGKVVNPRGNYLLSE
jgi:hypothetical protein